MFGHNDDRLSDHSRVGNVIWGTQQCPDCVSAAFYSRGNRIAVGSVQCVPAFHKPYHNMVLSHIFMEAIRTKRNIVVLLSDENFRLPKIIPPFPNVIPRFLKIIFVFRMFISVFQNFLPSADYFSSSKNFFARRKGKLKVASYWLVCSYGFVPAPKPGSWWSFRPKSPENGKIPVYPRFLEIFPLTQLFHTVTSASSAYALSPLTSPSLFTQMFATD